MFTMWVASLALGAGVSWIACLAVAPVSVFFQRLPLTYSGLGLREGSAAALLVALGYDYSAALLVLMTQVTMFLISLLPGAIALVLNGPQRVDAPSQAVLRSELGINADRHVPRE